MDDQATQFVQDSAQDSAVAFPSEIWRHREIFFHEGMRMEIGPCHRRYVIPDSFQQSTERFAGEPSLDKRGNLEDYRAGVAEALGAVRTGVRSLGGHGDPDDTRAPLLGRRDLLDLGSVLEELEDGIADGGSGLFPRVYPVNTAIEIWTDPLD